MKIKKEALVGTMESSDVMIRVYPSDEKLCVEVESIVYRQFGKHITELIRRTAVESGIEHGVIEVRDFGALDCTICARLETALSRAEKEATI